MTRRDAEHDDGDYRRGPLRGRPVEADADDWHPGDALAAPDLPPYPADWNAEQRTGAYWAAMRMRIVPNSTRSWAAIVAQEARQHQKHETIMETEAGQP